MVFSVSLLLFSFSLLQAGAVPTPASSSSASTPTVGYATTAANDALWGPDSASSRVAPIRGSLGASVMGPDNIPLDLENVDTLAPPTTDNGYVGNAKWSFGSSKNRLQTGGWARQQNVGVMPLAENLSGVNMRLEAGAIRELHWHKNAEWAYVLKGTTQVTAVDAEGRNLLATVKAGDLWFFPAGIPHSLQATADDPEGSEFLLVFDIGDFNEDGTFLLTDWLAHVPAEVIRKNFGTANPEAFAHIPDQDLYIFPSEAPADDAQPPTSPYGTVPQPYFYALSEVQPTQLPGGTVKVADSSVFNITTISAAEVTVEVGAMRELHWHPTMDEWGFFLEGEARVTIFAASGVASTFNYQGGDIAYVPAAMGHYVENIGNSTLRYLEIFNADRYQDISLNQWLALTPPALVKAHLNLDDETISHLSKVKQTVVAPL